LGKPVACPKLPKDVRPALDGCQFLDDQLRAVSTLQDEAVGPARPLSDIVRDKHVEIEPLGRELFRECPNPVTRVVSRK
jgi:hypothetical protein